MSRTAALKVDVRSFAVEPLQCTDMPGKSVDQANATAPVKISVSKAQDQPLVRPIQAAQTGAMQVDGSVLSLDDDDVVVNCEVMIPTRGVVRIGLHRDLFGEYAQVGQPFRLEIVDDDGIRRPKIVPRPPNLALHRELRDEIDAMVNDF